MYASEDDYRLTWNELSDDAKNKLISIDVEQDLWDSADVNTKIDWEREAGIHESTEGWHDDWDDGTYPATNIHSANIPNSSLTHNEPEFIAGGAGLFDDGTYFQTDQGNWVQKSTNDQPGIMTSTGFNMPVDPPDTLRGFDAPTKEFDVWTDNSGNTLNQDRVHDADYGSYGHGGSYPWTPEGQPIYGSDLLDSKSRNPQTWESKAGENDLDMEFINRLNDDQCVRCGEDEYWHTPEGSITWDSHPYVPKSSLGLTESYASEFNYPILNDNFTYTTSGDIDRLICDHCGLDIINRYYEELGGDVWGDGGERKAVQHLKEEHGIGESKAKEYYGDDEVRKWFMDLSWQERYSKFPGFEEWEKYAEPQDDADEWFYNEMWFDIPNDMRRKIITAYMDETYPQEGPDNYDQPYATFESKAKEYGRDMSTFDGYDDEGYYVGTAEDVAKDLYDMTSHDYDQNEFFKWQDVIESKVKPANYTGTFSSNALDAFLRQKGVSNEDLIYDLVMKFGGGHEPIW